jgi:hypothetical protein
MKFNLIVQTGYRENYGSHDWDGKGECPQYWKNKGGEEVQVATLSLEEASNTKYVRSLVNLAENDKRVCWDSQYSASFLIDWNLVEVGRRTDEEQRQFLADGRVYSPRRVIQDITEAPKK